MRLRRQHFTALLTCEGDSHSPLNGAMGEWRGEPPETRTADTPSATPLADHLRDAIRLNRARRDGYRQRGGTRAAVLSRALVASECLLILPARHLDRLAARHTVPILAAELADMADAPSPDRPLTAITRIPGPALRLRPVLRDLRRALAARHLAAAARSLDRLLRALRQREQTDGRRRALAVHVTESAGWMAERGAGYAGQTGGATTALSVRLVRGHLALLPFARLLDRLAAPVHARGAGLFVNDLPEIPFPATPFPRHAP